MSPSRPQSGVSSLRLRGAREGAGGEGLPLAKCLRKLLRFHLRRGVRSGGRCYTKRVSAVWTALHLGTEGAAVTGGTIARTGLILAGYPGDARVKQRGLASPHNRQVRGATTL